MSTRSAYHKLHSTHSPEYLFGMQISDAGQFFYESMEEWDIRAHQLADG